MVPIEGAERVGGGSRNMVRQFSLMPAGLLFVLCVLSCSLESGWVRKAAACLGTFRAWYVHSYVKTGS